ncbi:MAG: hypothetical protein WA970_21935 [Gammaproteobacteria bacterium]
MNEIAQCSLEELAALPIADRDRLCRQLAVVKETARRCETTLQAVMNNRYRAWAEKLRQDAGKTTGTVRFEEDGFVVTADLPKRTEYDQRKLKAAVETLRRWGENPDHYVAIEIKVSEAKYNGWPPAIRNLFEPARTLKTGKPSYLLAPVPAKTRDRTLSEVL